MADTVGVKNPHRYRGYRYDSETQLYYLQSRYYNHSWGRFMNADGIGGTVGELLGHNVFAYCKNNVVNMSDSNGFMPAFANEDTQRQYEDWIWQQQQAERSSSNNYKITKKELVKTGKNIVKNLGTGYVGYIATHLSEPSKIAFNREMYRAGQYLLIPGSKIAKGLGLGLAIFGIVDTISSIKEDWKDSKSWEERTGKIVIDVGVFTFSTIAGAVGSPAAGAGIGFGLNTLGDLAKNYLWDN